MSGKRALVTGASQGLGAYYAARLAEEGWAVTGVGRRPRAGLAMAQGIDYIQADLAAPETIETLLLRIGETPDIIVHSAVFYPARAKSRPTLSDMETVLRVNTLAPYLLTLALLDAKPEGKFCACVILNSEVIYHADAQSGLYAASKAALRVLTTSLADSCRSRNASVSTLLLGPLANPEKTEEARRLALKRGVREEEILRVFLRQSNPDLVIDAFIDFESCYKTLRHIIDLGRVANGMVCKLDGGSSGSLG